MKPIPEWRIRQEMRLLSIEDLVPHASGCACWDCLNELLLWIMHSRIGIIDAKANPEKRGEGCNG